MKIIIFMLNLPWTLCGLLASSLSIPVGIEFSKDSFALIVKVRSFWWYSWLPGKKTIRAMTNGHCIQLGPRSDAADRNHELIHVKQAIRNPFIFPFLYTIQTIRHGYRANKYEDEAYTKSGSRYEGLK